MRFRMYVYRFQVLGAEFLRWEEREASTAGVTGALDGSAAGVGAASAESGHRPVASHRAVTARASGQNTWPVLRLLKVFAMEPAPTMGHEHRFHALPRSSSSPEWESSGCFPVQSCRWRRYKLRAIIDPILHPRCTPSHARKLYFL